MLADAAAAGMKLASSSAAAPMLIRSDLRIIMNAPSYFHLYLLLPGNACPSGIGGGLWIDGGGDRGLCASDHAGSGDMKSAGLSPLLRLEQDNAQVKYEPSCHRIAELRTSLHLNRPD